MKSSDHDCHEIYKIVSAYKHSIADYIGFEIIGLIFLSYVSVANE